MKSLHVAPYGSWPSPISAAQAAAGSVAPTDIRLGGHGAIYWIEKVPAEGGCYAVMCWRPEGSVARITPPGFNVRSQVHEYGGAAYVAAGSILYFSNLADGRLYRQETGSSPQPITPTRSSGGFRYADLVFDSARDVLIAVREDHSSGSGEPVNTLVRVMPGGDPTGGTILHAGADFYSSPRISPDGSRISWLTWNHPQMPWDGTELWVAELTTQGGLRNPAPAAGGCEESIFQPEWSPDGMLYFVSDRTGWWNLYRRAVPRGSTINEAVIEAVCPLEAEFGVPQWVFGMSTYAFVSSHLLACVYHQPDGWNLGLLDVQSGSLRPVPGPFTEFSYLTAGARKILCAAASPTEETAIVELDPTSLALRTLHRPSQSGAALRREDISVARPIQFSVGGHRSAYGFYYAPRNCSFTGPPGELPPLLVITHGGPTGSTSTALRLAVQYWTSRGIAILDVDYGGSAGYGREYRRRLNGQWGIMDVEDAIAGAKYLVETGEVDGDRLLIRGGSAGGYTTLCALTFHDTFRAGASHFGIGDLEALLRDTHKFESRYGDSLIGPYPEQQDLYRARSPIHSVHRLACPVIFFQGLEDRVVPPNQAESMVEALRTRGVPVAYVPFEGEQHGFRRPENIQRALEAELYFYSRVLGFTLSEPIDPVQIENLLP